jgi:hypothetical protein
MERMKYFHGKLFTLTLPPQSSTSISDFIMNFYCIRYSSHLAGESERD